MPAPDLRALRFVAAASVLLAGCAVSPGQAEPTLSLPPRAASARTGSQLLPTLVNLSTAEREQRVWHELAAGNVPSFLRELVPITTQAVIAGQLRTATFWCTNDHFGVGDDLDWFRMPMTPGLAQQLADRLECTLPTRRMSDAIWQQAQLQLQPFPFSPTQYNIQSVSLFHQHHQQIESQRQGAPQDWLVAGIKKDVVASSLIASWPQRVCIYGWHYPSGQAIQPLSKVHGASYVDYSHGARLVARRCLVDGVATTIDAVLADPVLHPLLSDEGAFASWRYPTAGFESFPVIDAFPASGPEVTWLPKFTTPDVVVAPAPTPSGDLTVLRVMDPAGGTDSVRLEPGAVRDVAVQADLYCEHRPQLAGNGFERIGLFVRDRAAGAFDGTLSQHGQCYALTWDSHDGRLRCLRAAGGVLTDLLPQPRLLPGSAWRRFRVEARGSELTFYLDGERLLQVYDTTHPDGAFGIGYHESFANNAYMRGARADAVHADVPGAFALRLDPGLAPGTLRVRRRRGVPGDWFVSAFTLAPGAFPDGWFFGLDVPMAQLQAQLATGHPLFFGTLDGAGEREVVVPDLPLGLGVQGVALAADPTLRRWQVAAATATVVQ
jgi:hypothetical protein